MTGNRNAFGFQKLLYSVGRAGREHRGTDGEAADVIEMKSVHILLDRNAFQYRVNRQVAGQGKLHQDTVHRAVRFCSSITASSVSNGVDAGSVMTTDSIPTSRHALDLFAT